MVYSTLNKINEKIVSKYKENWPNGIFVEEKINQYKFWKLNMDIENAKNEIKNSTKKGLTKEIKNLLCLSIDKWIEIEKIFKIRPNILFFNNLEIDNNILFQYPIQSIKNIETLDPTFKKILNMFGQDTRNVFLVDTTGNLVYNTKVTIPNEDKSNIENTKQEMITKKKVTSLKSNPNFFDAYNFSEYQQNNFIGDNNWTYLQFGGLEQNIDISNIAGASKIENNNNLSENLGLYYIADAAINNKISLAIAYNISQQFINKSSLNKLISNQLTNNIINLIVENTNIFNFIKIHPFS